MLMSCASIKDSYKKNLTIDKSTAYFCIGMKKAEFLRKNPSITEKINESEKFVTYVESAEKYRYVYGIAIPMASKEYMFEFKKNYLIAVYEGRNNYNREIDYDQYPGCD